MTEQNIERRLAELLWNGRKMADVEEILNIAKSTSGAGWRPVGDRPNNTGTITMGSEPGLAVVERITNAFDALLELGCALNPAVEVSTPREAAAAFYGIPTSGLAEMDEPRAVADNTILSLEDSGVTRRPTILIRDRGMGESADRFPKTLLSLNENNKVSKPWTMGTYGQGGSSAFSFSQATIIVSRRHGSLQNGAGDHVAWTVVMERYDDNKTWPSYEYLVGADNEVRALDPSLFAQLEHGTQITHVEYDLQIAGPFTTNPWQFFQAALFDPVLPFVMKGTRGKEASFGNRVITGNAARLRNVERAKGDIEVAHSDTISLDLGERNGTAVARYWVVRRPADSPSQSDPTASYVQPKHAISVTLHGQRHDAEERYWIKKNANLSFLHKQMIVEIDATGLTGVARAELFAATRERARKSDIRMQLYDSLAYALREDPILKELNHEEKERLLEKSTAAANEKVRKRLGRFIKHKLEEFSRPGEGKSKNGKSKGGAERAPKRRPPGTRGKARDISDSHLLNNPTYLRFSKAHLAIYQAERSRVELEINAKNGYLPNNDDFLTINFEGPDPSSLKVVARSALLGGRTRWALEAAEVAPLGDYLLTVELMTPSGLLKDTLAIEVRTKRDLQPKRAKGGDVETGPQVRWVYRDQWEEPEINMNAKTVGRVLSDDDSTIILVNRHYVELDQALKARSLSPDQIETRADRYQYPVACGLWLQDYFVSNADDQDRPSDKYLDVEMGRLADAVLVAVDPDVDLAGEEEDYK